MFRRWQGAGGDKAPDGQLGRCRGVPIANSIYSSQRFPASRCSQVLPKCREARENARPRSSTQFLLGTSAPIGPTDETTLLFAIKLPHSGCAALIAVVKTTHLRDRNDGSPVWSKNSSNVVTLLRALPSVGSPITEIHSVRPEQKLQNDTEYPKHEDHFPSARSHPQEDRLLWSLDPPQHVIHQHGKAS